MTSTFFVEDAREPPGNIEFVTDWSSSFWLRMRGPPDGISRNTKLARDSNKGKEVTMKGSKKGTA